MSLVFSPLVPVWLVLILGVGGCAASLAALAGGLRSGFFRILATGVFVLALLNPAFVRERREDLPDTLIVLVDKSGSMTLERRKETAQKLVQRLRKDVQNDPSLDLIEASINNSAEGTSIIEPLRQALAKVPRARLSGVIAITDGQIRDTKTALENLKLDAPFHVFMTGDPKARDRRLRLISTPRFGLTQETTNFVVIVEDPGHEGESVQISLVLNGQDASIITARIGEKTTLPIQLPHRGQHHVSITVEAAPEELTLFNNHASFSLEGVRDRLRVLLITGEPHAGAREWRNLLKSDPSTDLVHFTILRPPGKIVMAPREELALIPFPTHELFEKLIENFDLIVFDRYPLRGVLSPLYLDNIARYVEKGGALLVTAGPPYAGTSSLYRSPLAAVLPARPTGQILTKPFRPALTESGKRHPVTRTLVPKASSWGRWVRLIEAETTAGTVLLSGFGRRPLLVLDRLERGRVAILLSDQAWLWSRGLDGGGPASILFRRLVHWLMKEPELEEEHLSARFKGGHLLLERTSLEDPPAPAVITTPSGENITAPWRKTGPGRFTADITTSDKNKNPDADLGLWGIQSGDLFRFVTEEPDNPREYDQVLASPDKLAPLASATGGGVFALGLKADTMPAIRRVRRGATTHGRGFAGLVKNRATRLLDREHYALWPALVLLALGLVLLAASWIREGRTPSARL